MTQCSRANKCREVGSPSASCVSGLPQETFPNTTNVRCTPIKKKRFSSSTAAPEPPLLQPQSLSILFPLGPLLTPPTFQLLAFQVFLPKWRSKMLSGGKQRSTPTGESSYPWLAEGRWAGECPQFLGVLEEVSLGASPSTCLGASPVLGRPWRASQALHTSHSPFFPRARACGPGICWAVTAGAYNSVPAPSLLSEEDLICPQHVSWQSSVLRPFPAASGLPGLGVSSQPGSPCAGSVSELVCSTLTGQRTSLQLNALDKPHYKPYRSLHIRTRAGKEV